MLTIISMAVHRDVPQYIAIPWLITCVIALTISTERRRRRKKKNVRLIEFLLRYGFTKQSEVSILYPTVQALRCTLSTRVKVRERSAEEKASDHTPI